MTKFRQQRVGEQLQIELADLIQNEVRDPRLGFVTVTEVRLSPDLQHARVYVSIFGDSEERRESFGVLERATGFLRSQVGRRMKLRHVPEIQFRLDETLDTSERIDALLDETAVDDTADEAGRDGASEQAAGVDDDG